MAQTISGMWLRNAYKDPLQAILHTADPSHTEPGQVAQTTVVHDAPELTAVSDIGQYPGAEWVGTEPGLVLNRTPWNDHTQGAPAEAFPTDLEAQTVNSEAHDVDQGGTAQANYYPLPLQFPDEKYVATRFEGLDSQPINDVALRRGLNGDPANNPDGFRRGFDSYHFVYRKFAVPTWGQRMHDMHVLTPNTATPIPDQPPGTTQYGSPFSAQARSITNLWSPPMMRRTPPPIDQAVIVDGSESLYPATDDWVVG